MKSTTILFLLFTFIILPIAVVTATEKNNEPEKNNGCERGYWPKFGVCTPMIIQNYDCDENEFAYRGACYSLPEYATTENVNYFFRCEEGYLIENYGPNAYCAINSYTTTKSSSTGSSTSNDTETILEQIKKLLEKVAALRALTNNAN